MSLRQEQSCPKPYCSHANNRLEGKLPYSELSFIDYLTAFYGEEFPRFGVAMQLLSDTAASLMNTIDMAAQWATSLSKNLRIFVGFCISALQTAGDADVGFCILRDLPHLQALVPKGCVQQIIIKKGYECIFQPSSSI